MLESCMHSEVYSIRKSPSHCTKSEIKQDWKVKITDGWNASSTDMTSLQGVLCKLEMYYQHYNLSSFLLRRINCHLLQCGHDKPCLTFCFGHCAVSAAWQWCLSSVEIPCKQKEAAVIVVPHFTSLEADKQLEGNRGCTEGRRGDSRCMQCVPSFKKCHKALIASMFMQPISVHQLTAVCGIFDMKCQIWYIFSVICHACRQHPNFDLNVDTSDNGKGRKGFLLQNILS